MSFFSPKVFIFKSIIKEKYKPKIVYNISTEERKKNLMNLKSKLNSEKIVKGGLSQNNINEIINKIRFGKAISRYLFIKKKIYLKELKEQENKEEFKFEKLNITIDKFARIKKKNKTENKNGVIYQINNAYNLNINSTFEKVWNKLSTKSYENFKEEFNDTQDKNKFILSKIKQDQKNINSMIDIKIKNVKKIFGNDVFNRVNRAKKEEPFFSLIKNRIKKGYNSTKNIKNKRFFSQKSLNSNKNNKNSILLKSSNTFNKKFIKSKENSKINLKETNEINFSDITNFTTNEKINIKKEFRFKSPNPRPSRNIKNSKINFVSERQNNNNLIQEFNCFTKKNTQMKKSYLKNDILKLNKIKNNMKTERITMDNFLSNKYVKDSAKINTSKKIINKNNNFKERLIKSVEIIFNDETNDY